MKEMAIGSPSVSDHVCLMVILESYVLGNRPEAQELRGHLVGKHCIVAEFVQCQKLIWSSKIHRSGMVVHALNPSTADARSGRSL